MAVYPVVYAIGHWMVLRVFVEKDFINGKLYAALVTAKVLSGIDVPFGIDAEPFGADIVPIGSDVRGILIRYADDFLFTTNVYATFVLRAKLLPELMIFFLPEG